MEPLRGSKINGGNSSNGRIASDYYPTPSEVTIALLDFLKLPKEMTIWEPACGSGSMSKAIEHYGYKVISSDLNDFGYGESEKDFLQSELYKCDWIITNPPFNKAAEFILRCSEHQKPFALLMKSHFWNAAKRYSLFQNVPPSYVLPLTWRPDFTGGGNALMDCSWYVWDLSCKDTIFVPLKKPD